MINNIIVCTITFVISMSVSLPEMSMMPFTQRNLSVTSFTQRNISLGEKRIPMGDKRIIGGTILTPYSWPYLVFMSYKLNSTTSYMCGGAVYNASFIITAAHCVPEMTSEQMSTMTVRVGEHSLTTKEGFEQIRGVSRVIVHPGYKMIIMRHDIALLQLSSPLNLKTPNVQPIVLNTDKLCPAPNDKCFAAGWGQLKEGKDAFQSDVPKEIVVPVIGNRECRMVNSILYRYTIFDNNICAGDLSGNDVCNGDSGGPLVCTCGGTKTHSGIVSWSKECGSKSLPAVYTRTSCYVGWIESGVEKYSCGGSNGSPISLGNDTTFLFILSWCALAVVTYHPK